MIELVVFDMAGTTVDEDNVVYKTVRDAIAAAGYSVTLEQVLAAGAGKEKSQAIRDVLDSNGHPPTDDQVDDIFADFKSRLDHAYRTLDVREQPGASELFGELKKRNIKIVLNTGYDRATAEHLVGKIGWSVGIHIDGLVTASDVANGRPAADMIQLAMRMTDIDDPAHVLKVGDSQIDIAEGQNAQCGMSVGITTGAQDESQLQNAGPSAIIHGLNEILNLVNR